MRADYRILIDACVLANHGVCDLLLRLSERPRLIVPHWSADILNEVRSTHLKKLHWPEDLAESFQLAVREAFPTAEVKGYQSLLDGLANHEKDQHVLAATIRGNCPLILTFNLRHFPSEALEPWSIQASHPQDYLLVLYEMEPRQMIGCFGEIAGRRQLELEDVVIRLGRVLPKFASKVLDDLNA